jgi:beta-phosphoglucomutase-like phosphatase (HAD superfamily)
MNIRAEACIVFEDAPFGIEAARRAGMRAVAVCTTHTPAQLAGPHVVASVRDYFDLMNSKFLENLHVATL